MFIETSTTPDWNLKGLDRGKFAGLPPYEEWDGSGMDNGSYIELSSLSPRKAGDRQAGFETIIGNGPDMANVFHQVRLVAATDATVLIQGETGTGKELIAAAIHQHSARRGRPYVTLNCAAIPSGLIESELFGHERGAFTGALLRKLGRFEAAHGGTIFLDEIGEMPLEMQPKLLRVLQEHELERLGSTQSQRIDVRVIAATNQSLPKMVASKQFRSDLYYRLSVFPIELPTLRDRSEDIPLLVQHFVSYHAARMRKTIRWISASAMSALQRYDWPGNIRELQNVIERAVIMTDGDSLEIPLDALRTIRSTVVPMPQAPQLAVAPSTLAEAERVHILEALRQTRGVVGGREGAAARLGLARTTLIARMQKLGIAKTRSVNTPAIFPARQQYAATAV